MGDKSHIQWTDATWNPVLGCDPVSPGCAHCYAIKSVWRMAHNPNPKIKQANAGLVERQSNGVLGWTGEVHCLEERLPIPLGWKQPRMIFVNSQSDLFHEAVPEEFIAKVFAVMAVATQHVYQVLTKRPDRVSALLNSSDFQERIHHAKKPFYYPPRHRMAYKDYIGPDWPFQNVWLGTSVENQETADDRLPWLLKTPAAVRWVSYEPALATVNFKPYLYAPNDPVVCMASVPQSPSLYRKYGLDWIVVGGESGSGARPFDVAWARQTIVACRKAKVPVFVKQLGSVPMMDEAQWRSLSTAPLLNAANHSRVPEGYVPLKLHDSHGGDLNEFPPDLQVREFPHE